jgi:cell pole-organizing protein PopZ
VQNAFAVLQDESKEEDDGVQTVITQMAALTTQSQLTATTRAETLASVAAAINQLNANQQAMQQQFAAFTTQRNTTYYQPSAQTMQPPISQFTIPAVSVLCNQILDSMALLGGSSVQYCVAVRVQTFPL